MPFPVGFDWLEPLLFHQCLTSLLPLPVAWVLRLSVRPELAQQPLLGERLWLRAVAQPWAWAD